ncbi:MAG: class I adenylate-forming enzyme family protein, partial [Verrucomicrobiota bacterium]
FWLDVLPGWEADIGEDSRLKIRGDALFSGYAFRNGSNWCFDSAKDENGWFFTGDCGELDEGRFRHLGRSDDLVKVLGELVSVSGVEAQIVAFLKQPAIVCAIPEARRGHDLVVVLEKEAEVDSTLERLNAELPGLERLARLAIIDEFPLTEIGKVDRKALRDQIC